MCVRRNGYIYIDDFHLLRKLKRVNNPLASLSVAIWVDRPAHFFVILGIVQQRRNFRDNLIIIRSDQLDCSGFQRFRTLRRITHNEYRLTQPGGFLLYASAVGQDNMAFLHQIYERQVFQRLDKE